MSGEATNYDAKKVLETAKRWREGLITEQEAVDALVSCGLTEMAAFKMFASWKTTGPVAEKRKARAAKAKARR